MSKYIPHPADRYHSQDGRTLDNHARRDYWRYEFAGRALAGQTAHYETSEYTIDSIARDCVTVADALIAALEEELES